MEKGKLLLFFYLVNMCSPLVKLIMGECMFPNSFSKLVFFFSRIDQLSHKFNGVEKVKKKICGSIILCKHNKFILN